MNAVCIVVGLISFATLVACVQKDVVVAVMVGRELREDISRIFLISGSLDDAAKTISFVDTTACEILRDNSITEAPPNYSSVKALLELYWRGDEQVAFTCINATIEDIRTKLLRSFKWNSIFKPTAATPTGTYKYAIHYQEIK